MPYLMYLRKSRSDIEAEQHGEGETLARHEKILTDLALRLHINVTNIYREVVSGETIAARPMMQQLLKEVEHNMWEGVLVVEVERLARGDTMDQGQVAKSFKLNNTKIVTPTKTYDPSNEFDEEYFEFGLFMSRREYKTINRRLQRGRISSLKEGKVVNSVAPYGYTKIKAPDGKGFTLAQVPEEAKTIRLIFDLYLSGTGSLLISDRLNSMGVKPRVSKLWSPSSIRDILKNPVYAGKVRWEWKKEIKQYENGQLKKIRCKQKEYKIYDGLHEPIVTWEEYEDVQEQLDQNNHSGISTIKLQNPLSGIVYCKKCGSKMTRLCSGSRHPYSLLACSNRKCDTVSSPLYLVENEIIKGLQKWLAEIKNDDALKPNVDYSTLQIISDGISKQERLIKELKMQHTRTYELLEKGIYSPEVFSERNEVLSLQISRATSELTTITNEYELEERRLRSKTELIPDIENLLDTYSRMDIETKNKSLKRIIEKVDYEKNVRNSRTQRDLASFELWILPRIR